MEKSTFVIDVDGTLCVSQLSTSTGSFDYANAQPISQVIERLRYLYDSGHTIILHSARGMRTHKGDLSLIEKHIRPVMVKWLETHQVPYHSLVLGKPWGPNVYYVDDRCLSPFEFTYGRGYDEILITNNLTL